MGIVFIKQGLQAAAAAAAATGVSHGGCDWTGIRAIR